jgi:L-ascorbate metabolism protein UlaG (beta-lactamase superfamily)
MRETVSVTWWGHATTTIELAGRRILTDPVLSRRLAHLTRISGGVPGRDASRADVVLLSHLHRDHLHVPSLRLLDHGIRIVAPIGTAQLLRRSAPELACRIDEVRCGDRVDVAGISLRAVRAEHDGRRSPISRRAGLALGFVLEADHPNRDRLRVWFAGDTGPFPAMSEIGPVEVAVIPIGGWGPTLGPSHLDPAQAAEAVRLVDARDAIPIHYGTFWPTGLRALHPPSFRYHFAEPGARFSVALRTACPDARAHILQPGETVVIGGPQS